MKKRLFGLALVLALCLTLLCVSALASSDSLGLWVGGVEVTASGNVTGDGITGTVSYDADTNTLTLNGATLSGSHDAGYFKANIYAKNDLNIVLEGSNSIGSGEDCAILAESDLKISGSGSLACGDSEKDAAFKGHGIYCYGDLKVENATLKFYVENDGINCWNGDVELNSTNINIESKSENSDCISGNNITITGGEVTLVSNGEKQNDSYGIYGDIVEICDAKVEIKAYYCGIYSSEALKVTGDNTNLSVVSMEDASEDFLAISAPYISVNDTIYSGMLKKLVVENGVVKDFTVSITPTEVYVNGVDLLTNEDGVPGAVYDSDTSTLTLTNVDLSVSYEDNAVIYADGDLNIVLVGENKVTANGSYVYGIRISGSLFISGDSLTVISNNSKAIDVDDNACIASGKLIAAGYTEGIDIGDDLYVLEGVEIEATSTTDYGIETGDDLIVYGGEITAVNESNRTAMDIDDNMKVYGGSIIATNKSGGRALDIDVDLLVYGGSIVATGEEYGIDVAEDFNIEGGTVSATATGTNGAALRIANNIDDIRTIGANGALTLNAATPVWNDGSSPWLQKNNGKLTVYVDSVEEIDQFLDAGGTLGFVLRQDITGTVTIPAGADVTISGGDEYTLTGRINCTVAADNTKTTRLTLDGLTLNGGGSTRMAVISQDQESKTVSGLDLSMNGCTVKNYTDKAVYLTNATALSIDGCTFTNNATGDMDKPNTKGDYTIDLNLVSVKAGELSITDSSFNGLCGDKAVIKVAARGGDSDADASDISGSAATVEKLTVSGCTFSAEDSAADLNIGTDNKSYSGTGEAPVNSTGSFAVSVSGNTTEVKINEAFKTYKNEDGNYIDTDTGEALQNTVVAVGESATKTDTGELEVKPDEPDEPDEPDIPDLPVIPDIPVVTPPASDDEPDDVQPAENPYTDVAEGAWYYDVVMQASEAGLMKGVTDTEFEPNGTLTRAMFWTILARAGGVDTDGGATWYAKAQAWAMENGVSDGTDAMGALTREQLATMLWRFAGEPTSAYSLSAYTDASSVSDYAETAMAWAVENGIITGMTDTTIEPQGTATRAQCAAMLMRFIESVA